MNPNMNPNLTEIAYILDRSGSMEPMTEAAITGFNAFLQQQLDEPGDVNFSLLLFDNEFLAVNKRTPLQDVRPLDATVYIPRGSTSLLDAIGLTIDELGVQIAAEPEEKRPAKVVFAIYTDGYENSSTRYTLEKINAMITHQRTKYGWEFLFLAANQDAIATAAKLGIAAHNSATYLADGIGTRTTTGSLHRKMKALRKQGAPPLPPEEQADLHAPMDQIVRDEDQKRRGH